MTSFNKELLSNICPVFKDLIAVREKVAWAAENQNLIFKKTDVPLTCPMKECRRHVNNKRYHNCTKVAETNGPLTLEEVGDIFNVTRERIRQIQQKAERKLRHPTRSNVLKKAIEDMERFKRF